VDGRGIPVFILDAPLGKVKKLLSIHVIFVRKPTADLRYQPEFFGASVGMTPDVMFLKVFRDPLESYLH